MSHLQICFSLTVAPTQRPKDKHCFYGEEMREIPNLGGQRVVGQSDSRGELSFDFDVARIARPLASAAEIIEKGDVIVMDEEDNGYIENKATHSWIPLRKEGNLYFIDQWVQVPEPLTKSHVVRQLARGKRAWVKRSVPMPM